MDIVGLLSQTPMILATLVLLVAAILKVGRERGGVVTLLGAGLLFLMAVVSPAVYHLIMPRLLEALDPEVIPRIYGVVGLLMNLAHALSVLLIALGFFLRPASRAAAGLPGGAGR